MSQLLHRTICLLLPFVMSWGSTVAAQHAEAISRKPDFIAVVVNYAGLWPQLQMTDDGTLLAFGYNAPAPTTLPADVECWASADGGQTWSERGIAAPRPGADANYHHHPPHLLRLKDQRLLLSYGNRRDGSIEAKAQRERWKNVEYAVSALHHQPRRHGLPQHGPASRRKSRDRVLRRSIPAELGLSYGSHRVDRPR